MIDQKYLCCGSQFLVLCSIWVITTVVPLKLINIIFDANHTTSNGSTMNRQYPFGTTLWSSPKILLVPIWFLGTFWMPICFFFQFRNISGTLQHRPSFYSPSNKQVLCWLYARVCYSTSYSGRGRLVFDRRPLDSKQTYQYAYCNISALLAFSRFCFSGLQWLE